VEKAQKNQRKQNTVRSTGKMFWKSQCPAEQASLFCSRFFVLLERKERNPALGFCFFWAKPKERRRE
jgi:hypothetical protein